MEERKLNFNAPLLSVRRFSATSAVSDRAKQKKIEKSPPNRRHTFTSCNSSVIMEQVTEPVAVPFMWEQIPGKAKDGIEHESQPGKEDSGTPRIPPGRVWDIVKYPVEKEVDNQIVVKPQIGTYSQNDNVAKLDCSNKGINGQCIPESDHEDDDVYSDALDTLSQTDSVSMNCSVNSLSTGSGSPVAKPSGTFSTDPQTRDFMMSRFLPAAKAMTLETPQYASRKQQSIAPEQPREVKTLVVAERKPTVVNHNQSIIIPHYDQDLEQEETEDEYDDYGEDSGNLSRKACGLLPRLCFKTSMCLLNPVPGLKVRTHSPVSSTREVPKPGKATYMKSHSQILEKQTWDAIQKKKSERAVESPRLLNNKPDKGVVESLSLLENKAVNGVQSPKRVTCESNRFTNPNEQQVVNRSPPKKPPGSARISPYRRERPQSPFRGGGFLGMPKEADQKYNGMPKEAEKYKANMLVKYSRSNNNNNNSQELVPYQSTRQHSGSLSPAIEKTLYVDTVNFAEISSPNSDSSGSHSQPQMYSMGKLEEPATPESCIQEIKCMNLLDGKGISEYETTGSMNSSRSSFSEKPDITKGQAELTMDCFRQNGGLDQESKALGRIKVRADEENLALIAVDDFSPLPPPLPKTPSESWLWRALPSVASRNSFSQSRFNPRKQEPQEPAATDTKWETIVKTSYLHHDHVRYSEELVPHYSQQSKA
ncbi:hypothetical protein CCACVL1_15829 [Corchorus capsularis]|uniref:Uncharacterized protein n=1 Tax=Corchorus capsularis TaxID=210143 RepID=A0A1R3I0V7_COCAP|nr:hypothetical protein CCACVL1_15829 [Corchorus capsularis]